MSLPSESTTAISPPASPSPPLRQQVTVSFTHLPATLRKATKTKVQKRPKEKTKTKKRKTTRALKAKGRGLQNKTRDAILDYFKPHLKMDDVRSTTMGSTGEDILMSPLAQSLMPYTFECKKRENMNLAAAFRQNAKTAARTERRSVIVFSRNRKPMFVAYDILEHDGKCLHCEKYCPTENRATGAQQFEEPFASGFHNQNQVLDGLICTRKCARTVVL